MQSLTARIELEQYIRDTAKRVDEPPALSVLPTVSRRSFDDQSEWITGQKHDAAPVVQTHRDAAMKALAPVVHPFHGPGHAGGQGAGIDEGSGDAHAITNGHGRKRRIKGGSG